MAGKLSGIPLVKVEIDSLGNFEIYTMDPRISTRQVAKLLSGALVDILVSVATEGDKTPELVLIPPGGTTQ